MFEEIFKYKSVNFNKLKEFGFQKKGKDFVFVDKKGNVTSQVFDKISGDEYALYLMQNAEGEFVGQVRAEVESALRDICEKCYQTDVFKSKQAKAILDFVNANYGDKLEFLWEKFPSTAILRRKDNKKWYAALLVIPKSKLKVKSDEIVDIIDIRIQPERLPEIVDNQNIFEGYHMNKKHWITICLNDSISTQKVLNFVENSYKLAKK